MPAITPCLWFDGQAEKAATLYTSLFPNSGIDMVSKYGERAPLPAGTVMMVAFHLDGKPFMALNGGPLYSFTEAVSFSIDCADQAEVDHYWNGLIAEGGSPGPCGWLKDRFGLSWQVVPQAMVRMQKDGTADQIGRMMGAMMQMSKLDVAALEAAFKGEQ